MFSWFSYLQKRWITASTNKRLLFSLCLAIIIIIICNTFINTVLSDFFDELSESQEQQFVFWFMVIWMLISIPYLVYGAYWGVTYIFWPSDFQKGVNYYYGQKGDFFNATQDYKKAVKYFRKAIEKGNADAKYFLGRCYEGGLGVQQDYEEAVKWYRKAVEQDNTDAQWQLGYCYEKGFGVSQDFNEALKWYRKAAERGNAKYQFYLGTIYETDGNGYPQDYQESVKWYREAAGHVKWNYGLATDEKWYRKVIRYFAWSRGKKVGELANAVPAIYALGRCYEDGHGVPKDTNEAIRLFRKAAKLGNDAAKVKLKELWKLNTSSS